MMFHIKQGTGGGGGGWGVGGGPFNGEGAKKFKEWRRT